MSQIGWQIVSNATKLFRQVQLRWPQDSGFLCEWCPTLLDPVKQALQQERVYTKIHDKTLQLKTLKQAFAKALNLLM